MASRVKEYLAKIREREGLKNAILCGITISKKERLAEFFLVTDKTYSLLDEAAEDSVLVLIGTAFGRTVRMAIKHCRAE